MSLSVIFQADSSCLYLCSLSSLLLYLPLSTLALTSFLLMWLLVFLYKIILLFLMRGIQRETTEHWLSLSYGGAGGWTWKRLLVFMLITLIINRYNMCFSPKSTRSLESGYGLPQHLPLSIFEIHLFVDLTFYEQNFCMLNRDFLAKRAIAL